MKTIERKSAVLAIAIAAVFAIGCGCAGMFAPDRNVAREIAEAEVIGTWRMTAKSLELLKKNGFASDPAHKYTITFEKGGSLAFASADDFRPVAYFEGPGRWALEHQQKSPRSSLLLIVDPHGSWHFQFADERQQLILWKFLGDPDSWEFIEYERVK